MRKPVKLSKSDERKLRDGFEEFIKDLKEGCTFSNTQANVGNPIKDGWVTVFFNRKFCRSLYKTV